MVVTTEGFLEVALESWLDSALNLQPLNSIQTLYPTEVSGQEYNSLSEPTLHSYSNLIPLFSIHHSFQSFSSSVATFALREVMQRKSRCSGMR